jgi:hypothetical protein
MILNFVTAFYLHYLVLTLDFAGDSLKKKGFSMFLIFEPGD